MNENNAKPGELPDDIEDLPVELLASLELGQQNDEPPTNEGEEPDHNGHH